MVTCHILKTKRFFLGVAAVFLTFGLGHAKAVETSPGRDADLHREIRSYLLENPEVIAEALEVLQARRQKEAHKAQKEVLTKNVAVLYESADDPVLGNPYGDVTVILFSDYRCGYCKQASLSLMRMVEKDNGLRVIVKEFPILGQISTLAAQYALAAHAQGKYQGFHTAMMAHKNPITRETLRQKAKGAGVNMARLDQDITDKSIAETLTRNRKVAIELGLQGTPAFIIGSEVFRGNLEYHVLKKAVQSARSA